MGSVKGANRAILDDMRSSGQPSFVPAAIAGVAILIAIVTGWLPRMWSWALFDVLGL